MKNTLKLVSLLLIICLILLLMWSQIANAANTTTWDGLLNGHAWQRMGKAEKKFYILGWFNAYFAGIGHYVAVETDIEIEEVGDYLTNIVEKLELNEPSRAFYFTLVVNDYYKSYPSLKSQSISDTLIAIIMHLTKEE